MKNYEIKINQDYNSTEIIFSGKPSESVRATLKENGYRWHKLKGVWYGKKTVEELEKILNGEKVKKTQGQTPNDDKSQKDKQEQQELRKEFLTEIKAIAGEKWLDYYNKGTARIVKFENGQIFAIEKPSIETRFCFGHGQNGISTEEEEDSASDMATYAATNENYFINENLKRFEDKIKSIEEYGDFYYACPRRDNSKKVVYVFYYHNSWYEEDDSQTIKERRYKLTEIDLAKLKDAYEIEKANFEKCLRTYLKRYGLSKIHSWTYLVD